MSIDPSGTDVSHWFGLIPEGCDVRHWMPFLTASEAGFDQPKLTIDFETGIEYVSYPAGSQRSEPAAVVSAR